MSTNRNLLNEFIKVTNDDNKDNKQQILYGTIVMDNNTKCVKIDGSDIKTPMITTTDVKENERVLVSIQNHTAVVTGNLSDPAASNSRVENAEGKIGEFDYLFAGNITADNIQAGSITTDKLLAGCITSDKIAADSIQATHISAGAITAGSGIISDGAIGNAEISKLDAGKITSGKIDTSNVTISGKNGNLKVTGNRLQVFEGVGTAQKERVSLGDVNADGSVYGLRVRGSDGVTILLDENGVKSEGITNGSITNDKINPNAGIEGGKLDIDSVIDTINSDGSKTINSIRIDVDDKSLSAVIKEINDKSDEFDDNIKMNTMLIEANTEKIKLKVDEQIYQADKEGITSQMNKNTSSIDILKGEIDLKVEQTDIDDMVDTIKSEIKITTDGISNRVDKIETDTSNFNNRLESAEHKIKPGSIVSTVTSSSTYKNDLSGKVNSNSIISTINQTAESIKINASKVNLSGYVTMTNLATSGQTVIDGGNIKAESIALESLSSSKGDPIIKLFPSPVNQGYCSLDATKQYETGGYGSYIRLKWDNKNYWYVGDSAAGLYLGRNDNHSEGGEYDTYFWISTSHARIRPNKFMIGTGNCRIDTTGGSIRLYRTPDGVADYGLRLNSNCGRLDVNSDNITMTSTSGKTKTIAYTDHTHSNYATTSHTHSNYATTSHSHSGNTWEYLKLNKLYSNYLYVKDGSSSNSWSILSVAHLSAYSTSYALGQSNKRWNCIYLVSSPNVSSDLKLKKNVRYIDDIDDIDDIVKTCSDDKLTSKNLHDFIKDDLKIAEYDYIYDQEQYDKFDNVSKGDIKKSCEGQIGFIAQDIVNTKVGSKLITEDVDGTLSYKSGNFTTIIAGALQEEIRKREELEVKYKELESRLVKLEKILNMNDIT